MKATAWLVNYTDSESNILGFPTEFDIYITQRFHGVFSRVFYSEFIPRSFMLIVALYDLKIREPRLPEDRLLFHLPTFNVNLFVTWPQRKKKNHVATL